MSPLALGALAAYLTATVASRLPGQRERHGLAAAWWWLGMFALALHAVLHYTRWQALGGVDLHFFAALSLVTAAMSAITLLLGVNRDSSLLAIVAFPIAALMLGLYALFWKPTSTPAARATCRAVAIEGSCTSNPQNRLLGNAFAISTVECP